MIDYAFVILAFFIGIAFFVVASAFGYHLYAETVLAKDAFSCGMEILK